MSEKRVTKIKINREKSQVGINWEEKDRLGNWGKYTVSLYEPALPEFVRDYHSIGKNAVAILELPEYDPEKIDVSAINFQFVGDEDVMAATISIYRELEKSLSGVSETTPLKYTDHVFEGEADPRSLFGPATIELLKALQEHALNYVAGERAQAELFGRDDDEENSETSVGQNGDLETADVAEDKEEPF